MKRSAAFALATLLCLGFAACGTKPAPKPSTQVLARTFNNGGRYVQYAGDVYYWEYWPECLERSGIWGEFPEVPGIRRSMIQLQADGTQEGLFIENGYGPIWIYRDRFYLAWLDDDYTSQLFSTALERGDVTGAAMDRCELGPGEIFALDEARGLLIASVSKVNEDTHRIELGICVIDAENGERTDLPLANVEPLFYDEPGATLYYRDFSIGDPDAVKLGCVDVATGSVRDIAWLDIRRYDYFEDVDAVEFDNAWLEGESLHVIMSGYSGNAHMHMASAYLVVDLTGDTVAWTDAGAVNYDRYAVNRPFDMREMQGYDEFYGYYIRTEQDELLQILTYEDIAQCGLPGGPYYYETAFGDVEGVEYADNAVFFSVLCGPRNEAEDIGWREAYDLSAMHVYRKDLATGEIEELYYFDEYSMRGG